MAARRTVDGAERRARLGTRHALAPGAQAADVERAAVAVVALHATDPASVFLAVRARTLDGGPGDVERALYDDRTVVRLLGMRRTMFVVPVDLLPVVQAACATTIAAQQRQRLGKDLVASAVVDEGGAEA